ncbi:MAG: T9SS type A sorting domain-containing protein, partial [Bacteroidota bacterium]
IYDLSYVDDRLASIVQSSLSEATGRTFPVFRYDEFKHGNDHLRFSGFRTGIFIGDEWITFRRDSITVLNDRLIRWDGISTEAGKPSSVQSCRLLLDKNGNLTDLLQYTASDEIASLELIGHLHFEIEYEADGISPAKVTTSYMKPDKTYGYSLKLVYSDRKPSDNGKSLTIFPNPANDHCAIYLSGNSVINGTITATDSQGRTMFSMQGISIESRGFTFDTSTFPPGTYQVQVVDNGFQSVGKFVVVR